MILLVLLISFLFAWGIFFTEPEKMKEYSEKKGGGNWIAPVGGVPELGRLEIRKRNNLIDNINFASKIKARVQPKDYFSLSSQFLDPPDSL